MTNQTMPEWATPGAKVVVFSGEYRGLAEAEVSRVTEASVFVTSPAWAKGYERRFVPRRTQWANASARELEEYGGRNSGFNSAARCVPADSEVAQKAYRREALVHRMKAAQLAAETFQKHPTKAKAEEAVAALQKWIEVAQ